MSYGMRIVHTSEEKKNDEVRVVISPENQIGGIVCDSNLIPAEFNVTYNYSDYLRESLKSEKSIRCLYNKPLIDVLSRVSKAIVYLIENYYPDRKFMDYETGKNYEIDKIDYWKSCPYNVVKQLDYIRTVIIKVLEQEGNEDCVLQGD